MSERAPTRVRVGVVLWLLRPAYLLTEVAAAAGARGYYSFADDTVSDLGVLGCVTGAGGGPLCSPWHAVMNGSFVVFGLTLALGAVLPDDVAGRGAVERLALWPTFLVLPLAACAVVPRRP